ncbi:hypothetical protein [Pseudogracilibacillus auburnensis]|uniref:hypothetical protein n=1 Tax=Pseudogracilibacillus auburnensis TaxID=1494959 RepID=UPI001A95FF8D|nr:hypothetical protein [Pseudogracilibacillus auburnensis]MBO1004531.1 hypothetical protein [Pseudogracilibacillus auburnensis]
MQKGTFYPVLIIICAMIYAGTISWVVTSFIPNSNFRTVLLFILLLFGTLVMVGLLKKAKKR